MAYIGTSPSNGVRRVHTYTATANQTTFTGSSTEGVTLSYADTNYIDVFQNGVLLGSADYTSTSGTSVVLAQGASVSDLVVIVVYDVFSVADTVSKTAGGSFDSAITIGGTLGVTGETTLATHLNMGDDDKIKLGAGSDLQLYHDGTNSYVNNTTGNLIVQSGANAYMNVNSSENAVACIANGAVGLYYDNSEKLVTTTHGITVNGRQTILHNGASDYAMYVYNDGDNANRYGIYMQIGDDDGTGTSIFLSFVDGDGNTVGSVTFTGSTTSFNTSSDYRLKNNITDLTDATAKVKELKPKKFSWKKDKNSTLIHGFLAHEVAEVIPEAVVGEKDAMTEEVLYVDGDEIPKGKKVGDVKEASKIAPQGIDPSKLIPLLTKAIQELSAKNDALETRIKALESK